MLCGYKMETTVKKGGDPNSDQGTILKGHCWLFFSECSFLFQHCQLGARKTLERGLKQIIYSKPYLPSLLSLPVLQMLRKWSEPRCLLAAAFQLLTKCLQCRLSIIYKANRFCWIYIPFSIFYLILKRWASWYLSLRKSWLCTCFVCGREKVHCAWQM